MLIQKLVAYAFYPTVWVIVALVLALVLFCWGRVRGAALSVFLGLVVLVFASMPLVAVGLWKSLEGRYPILVPSEQPKADVIVVLGGGIALPEPPQVVPDLNDAADRVWYAAELYHAGKAPWVVVSGGQVFPRSGLESEAEYHRKLLERMGVPAEAILVESASRDTAGNAMLTAALMRERKFQKALLVTSAAHMPRAVLLFEHAGVDVVPASCDVHGVDMDVPLILKLLPVAWAFQDTERALHEWLAFVYYRYFAAN
ncbi:conserved hypothetical protein [gamma proteobacterium HdN1]|nr:conserved hypothetical protein [gamma proteobacterium HdN1]